MTSVDSMIKLEGRNNFFASNIGIRNENKSFSYRLAASNLKIYNSQPVSFNEDKVKNVLLGNSVSLHDLYVKAKPLTKEEFSPYGDVIEPVSEEEQCSNGDANLMLNKGTPRLYVMRLRHRKLHFEQLTHHASVTQTLGALGTHGLPWYLAVAKSTLVVDESPITEITMLKSSAGHCYLAPKLDEVEVFRIGGSQMINLHVGTWHQGPFFEPPEMDFYNLELSNTGETDHTTHQFGITVKILDEDLLK